MRDVKTTAIGILGVHRSGTSLVTRAVNLLGAHLGEKVDLMPPTPHNPEGYWEHLLIYDIHKRILKVLRRTWDAALPLPTDWQNSNGIAPFRDELIELIETRFSGQPVWAWKDPRTSILLPLWKEVLTSLEIELRCLLVFRNPLDVARSLEARDGISIEEGLGLWFNQSLAMLQNSAGFPRALVSYHEMLADPVASVSRWAPHFPLQWAPDDVALRETIQQAVRTDLCHSKSTLQDLSRAGCPAPIAELTEILDEMATTGGPDGPEFEPRISRLLESHTSLAGLYARDFIRADTENAVLEARLKSLEEELAQTQARTREQDHLLDKQKKLLGTAQAEKKEREDLLTQAQTLLAQNDRELAKREGSLNAANANLQKQESRLAELQHAIVDKEQALGEIRAQLATQEGEVAVLRARIEHIESTYSWRITRPLRTVLDTFYSSLQRLRQGWR